jgi:Ser/Thr protein kinase RdoA (MazF antagonist)
VHAQARFARAALAAYGLPADTALRLLSISENAIFGLDSAGWVLRVHRPGYHSYAAVCSELDWMADIRGEAGIRAPEVITALSGARVLPVSVGTQSRLVDVLTYLPGVSAEQTRIGYRELGALTAAMHRRSAAWTPPAGFTRFRWDLESGLGSAARWGDWRRAPNLTPDGLNVIAAAAEEVTDRLVEFGTGPGRFGLIHADLRPANLIVDNGSLAVIDFDDCGWSWYLYDLAAALSFIEESDELPQLAADWLAGYQAVRPLGSVDLAVIGSMIMLRRIMLTAWLASRPDSEPARMLGGGFAAGTAAQAVRYLNDQNWWSISRR